MSAIPSSLPKNPRILIIALSGIGNLLMQSPLWHVLKKQYPGAHITLLLAHRGTEHVLHSSSDVNDILYASPKPSLREYITLCSTLRRRAFDVGIVAYPGQRVMSSSLLFFGGITLRIGHPFTFLGQKNAHPFLTEPIAIEPVHDVLQNYHLLKPLGIEGDDEQLEYSFPLSENDMYAAQEFLRSHSSLPPTPTFVGFHPGSHRTMPAKRWPADRFIALGKKLCADNASRFLLIFGGPDEKDLVEHIAHALNGKALPVLLPLPETAALMRSCRFFVSNDSGLMHVAVSQHVPTFGLFGPTDERRTAPWGPFGHVIRAQGTKSMYIVEKGTPLTAQAMDALSVKDTYEALQTELP